MMPVIWQQQEDKRVGSLPRGSSGESNLGEGKSVQFGMPWLWSSYKTIGRRHSAGSLHVGLDAEEVWAGERESWELLVHTLSLFLDSVVSGKLKGECVCLGKGMEGATMSDVA